MKKLKLNVEQLQVDSFRTGTGEELRGTVRGNSHCQYSGDPKQCPDETEYWSTCDGNNQTPFCPVSGMNSCGCSNEPETCASPCAVSDMTDCHRC